jgi:hypothetical protein
MFAKSNRRLRSPGEADFPAISGEEGENRNMTYLSHYSVAASMRRFLSCCAVLVHCACELDVLPKSERHD